MKKLIQRSVSFWLALLLLASTVVAGAADVSYGIPSTLQGIWQYVGKDCADDAATTWMRGNAYRVKKPYSTIDTDSSEYRSRYEKLQQDPYLKGTKICILYLPLCPYSKSYLPVFQDMAYDCNAQVLAVDLTAYLTASLSPYYSVATFGATSPIVLYLDQDNVPQGYSGVHSAAQFAEILKAAGYEPDYVETGSERYTVEQEYKKTVLNETNRERLREGLLPLSTYDGLQQAADLRAKEVNVLPSHTRPDGTLFTTALTDLSAPSVWGENLCAGPIVASPTAAMTGWMNSPGHRANILSKSYSHIGVGYYCNTTNTSRYKDNWVQVFSGTCGATSISVDTPHIEVAQGFPISDMDITVTLTCPVHGKTTMPLIDEMCTGYDKDKAGEQYVTVHYGDLTTGLLVSTGKIEPIEITPDMVRVAQDGIVYTGQPLTPAVSVYSPSGEYVLLENYSYTVEYDDNVDAGIGTVTVTGKGNYTGTVSKTFPIQPKDLRTATIEGIAPSYEYTSDPLTPTATVYSDGTMLYQGQDYTIAYQNNVGAVVSGGPGKPDTVDTTATITATGMGNYTGTVSTTFEIVGDMVFQKATQMAKRVWPSADDPQYGTNAYEFWHTMSTYPNFQMARNEVEASLKAAKEGGYFDAVMACTTYPEAARRINDYYRFMFEYDNKTAPVEPETAVKAATIDPADVALEGIEMSLGSVPTSVELTIADTALPTAVDAAKYDVFSAVPLEIDLTIDEKPAALTAPVTITMTLPESLGDGSQLVVLHYKDGADKAPEELPVVVNEADRTFSFATTSFSPFVLVNKLETYEAVQKDTVDDTFGVSENDVAPAPTDVQAIRSGENDITVSWTPAADTTIWTVTGYTVAYSTHEDMSDAVTSTVGADASKLVFSDLANDTYYVSVSTLAKSAWTENGVTPSHVAKVTISPLSNTAYAIDVQTPENGKVEVSPVQAVAGTRITVDVRPANGYVLDQLTVLRGASAVETVSAGDNSYTFVMPAAPVTVSATFKAEQTEPDPVPTTPVAPSDEVKYVIEHYQQAGERSDKYELAETAYAMGKIGTAVKAEPKTYEGYTFNAEKSAVSGSGVLKAIKSDADIVTLKLYYDCEIKTTPIAPSGEVKYIVEHYKQAGERSDEYKLAETAYAMGKIGTAVKAESKIYEGYTFNAEKSAVSGSGVLKAIETDADIVTLKLYYDCEIKTTPVAPSGEVKYIVEHYQQAGERSDEYKLAETAYAMGTIGTPVTAEPKTYDGYTFNAEKSVVSGELKAIKSEADIVTLKLYYDYEIKTTPVAPSGEVKYIVEHYQQAGERSDKYELAETAYAMGKIGTTVKAEPKTYDGYTFNADKSVVSGELKAIQTDADIVTLKLYYDVKKTSSGGSSGGSGGSGGSSSSSSTTTKVDSTTGAVIKTTKKSDGSSVTTVKQTDGTTTTIKTAANGKAEIKSTLSSKAVAAAQDKDEAVALQIAPVTVTTDSKKADAITVDTGSKTKTKVAIPVEDVTEGVVAVVIGADGQQTILKDTVATADGVTVVVADDTTIKLVDNSKAFVDVADAYWGADAVDFVSARGLMNGTGKDRFSPSSDLTRGMIAVILHNYEDNPESAATSAFTDVANGVWYDEAVRWAADEGIMNGYSADVFAPNDSITREQLATILWRYAGSPAAAGKLDRFADAGAVSSYAGAALDWATENGIVTGKGGDTLDPKGNATRAEVATMLMRFCKL